MNTNFFNALSTTPDQSLLPSVWLTWATKREGTIYLCCANGKTQNNRENWMGTDRYGHYMTYTNAKKHQFCVYAGVTLKFAYSKYHESVGLLELAVVTMNSNRTGGARKWEYAKGGRRYFIDKHKHIYNSVGREINDCSHEVFYAYENHTSYRFKDFIAYMMRCCIPFSFTNEFQKLLGSNMYISHNGRAIEIAYAWSFHDWYETPVSKSSTGKTQKLLDTLCSLTQADLTHICEGLPVIGDRYNSLRDAIYYEKLNDEWSVLRYCYRAENDSNMESYRIFISESGKCHCAKLTNNGEWVPAQNLNHDWCRSYPRFVNMDEAIDKSKRLSYIMPFVKTLPERQCISALTMAVKHPELEQLFKMGYTKLAENLMNNGTVNANIKEYIGNVNKKGKTLFSKWGINKHQMDILNAAFDASSDCLVCNETVERHYRTVIKLLKKYFNNDLSHFDNETFDRLAYLMYHFCARYLDRSLVTHLAAMNVDIPKWLTHAARWLAKTKPYENRAQILTDTMKSYKELDAERRPEINWYFDSYSDAVRAHDALIEIQRIQRRERNALYSMEYSKRLEKQEEMRKKVDEKRKHYEYEDDNFIIRLPIDNNEIVSEGSNQHICISNYVDRHSSGQTNLFFLRYKNTPNTPFYAIEMRDNSIVQIHGFGNKWLGNNPEAIPTVVRWLRKHNITCDQKILTCTATGYSRTGTYIPMPVVED